MKKAIGIFILLMLLPFSIHAEQQVFSCRCPNGGIVKPRMRKAKVLELCGEPDTVVHIDRKYQKEKQGWVPHKTKRGAAGAKQYWKVNVWKAIISPEYTVEWERWIYRPKKKFPVIITFRKGLVERIAYGDK
jgi:hypothetical protein